MFEEMTRELSQLARENGVSSPFYTVWQDCRSQVKMPRTFPVRLTPWYVDYIIKKKCTFITSKYIKQFN